MNVLKDIINDWMDSDWFKNSWPTAFVLFGLLIWKLDYLMPIGLIVLFFIFLMLGLFALWFIRFFHLIEMIFHVFQIKFLVRKFKTEYKAFVDQNIGLIIANKLADKNIPQFTYKIKIRNLLLSHIFNPRIGLTIFKVQEKLIKQGYDVSGIHDYTTVNPETEYYCLVANIKYMEKVS